MLNDLLYALTLRICKKVNDNQHKTRLYLNLSLNFLFVCAKQTKVVHCELKYSAHDLCAS